MEAHHAQHIRLANEDDIARLLGLGGSFVVAAPDGGSNAQRIAAARDPQD